MIIESAIGDYTDFRIPGMVVTEKGTLLRYCECRKGQNDWSEIDIKIARSTDEAKSWETVALLRGNGSTLNNPVIFVDGDTLVLLYCKNYREIWRSFSTDDGESFSPAERVNFEDRADFFYNAVAVGPGHGIVHNGRLIVPVWFAYNREDPKDHHPSFISTLYSDDHGKSWSLGEIIYRDVLLDPSECALAVNEKNEVLISIRHIGEERTRAIAKSPDGISSWYGLEFNKNLPDPICMGSMYHRDGVIYHINCNSTAGRKNLALKISSDSFKSCREIAVSEFGGYADIALLNNKIFVFYEKSVFTDNKYEPFVLCFDVIDL